MSFITNQPGIVSDLPENKLERIHPKVQTAILQLAAYSVELGYTLKIVSGFRTLAEQMLRWESYINGISPYPARPPRFSAHEGPTLDFIYSLAADMLILDINNEEIDVNNQVYKQYGRVWNRLNSIEIDGVEYYPRWNMGYNPIHFEYNKATVKIPPILYFDEEE